jgi:hypothetical protein
MEPAAQHLAGKSADQDGQPFDLGFAIRELDKHHDLSSRINLPETLRESKITCQPAVDGADGGQSGEAPVERVGRRLLEVDRP